MSKVPFSFLSVMAVVLALTGCTEGSSPSRDHAQDEAQIQALMSAQEAAWNAGDLEGFMEPYWHSDSLLFVGSRGPTKGWQATLENYRKGYPDRTAMGRLVFGVQSIDFPSKDLALMVGSWRLEERGELEALAGWFSLVWERKEGRWVITRDHSS